MATPSPEVEEAFLAEVTDHVRRVDIYEADGSTVWMRNAPIESGSVSVDYGRDERRSIEVNFDNSEGLLTYDPNSFWYDKILKAYRGVKYQARVKSNAVLARNLVYSAPAAVGTGTNVSAANQTGPDGRTNWRQLSIGTTTSGVAARQYVPLSELVNGLSYTTSVLVYNPSAVDLTIRSDWCDVNQTTFVLAPGEVRRIYVTASKATYDSTYCFADLTLAAANTSVLFNDWMIYPGEDQTQPYFNGDFSAARWAGTPGSSVSELLDQTETIETRVWETQVGEFMIDSITEPHFPNSIKVQGRDYAKKMLNSKFVAPTAFNAGASVDAIINAIASNAGIDAQRRLIPLTGKTLGRDYLFDRGTSRWEACKQIADAYGYEFFFNAEGYLVMRAYNDPTTSPLVYSFKTGEAGNIVNYDKTVNDTRIKNHIIVSGEASDTIPVWAEARNDNPASPTNIALIGDRYDEIVSPLVTTTAQAQAMADQFLSISSLQEFSLNFASLMLPWLDVGDIIEFVDPKAPDLQPDRLLLSTLTIPLDLGPMSGTGKRVTIVG